MPTFEASVPEIVAALDEHYGPRVPADAAAGHDPFRALVAVLLGRVADPAKVGRSLRAMADAGLLDAATLAEADLAEIVDALKSSGVHVAARGLASIPRLARWLVERHHGDAGADGLGAIATEPLREELSSLNGIGPATADALLLLALGRPAYPLDRATYRVFVRHGWLDLSAGYDEARAVVEHPCSDDPETLARLSDGFERIGRDFCRARAPKCDPCPLRPFLPEGGPIEAEDFASDT